jgi:hypothetical protein
MTAPSAPTLETPSFDGYAVPHRAAKLSRDEIARFRSDGFVVLHDFFAFDEIAWLRHETDILARRWGAAHVAPPKAVWANEAPEGTVYGLHLRDESLRRLTAHPRLLGIVQYVLGGEVGVHQTRLLHRQMTLSEAGLVRRDFPVWSSVDGMKRPQALTAMAFLGDSGPGGSTLHVLPRSHRSSPGVLPDGDRVIIDARIGAVLLYDANLAYVLGGPAATRVQPAFLVSYNLLGNEARAGARAEIYAARRPQALSAEAEDCLWPSALCAAG